MLTTAFRLYHFQSILKQTWLTWVPVQIDRDGDKTCQESGRYFQMSFNFDQCNLGGKPAVEHYRTGCSGFWVWPPVPVPTNFILSNRYDYISLKQLSDKKIMIIQTQ